MRNLMSWGSMLCFSIIAQIQTFLFCGLACGYAFGVYAYLNLMRYEFIPQELRQASGQEDVLTGVYIEQWEGVSQAARVGDVREVVQQMPIVGWYFLVGFAVGAVVFVMIVNLATIYQLRRLAAGASRLVDDLGAEPLLSFSDAGSLDQICRELLVDAVETLSHLSKSKLKVLVKCLVESFQSGDGVNVDQATYLRYLAARWDVATPLAPVAMISQSAGPVRLSFTR
ncbi:hypothetical protein Mal15_57650 [Stieleria maiorica]|uniref:Uncharacterized protein n=1 Tax=Stieleria maiorica TaxID=2795974 RepID=A0A5B9MP23_9BACT|nr:hypothetical protein [Stieleria maiorica]QEG01687.1 hypothetical protein Mal15_57650 [Stieleria maiorica]